MPTSSTPDPFRDPLARVRAAVTNATVTRWGKQDVKKETSTIWPKRKSSKLYKLVQEGRFLRLDHLWEPGRNGVLGNIGIKTIAGYASGRSPHSAQAVRNYYL